MNITLFKWQRAQFVVLFLCTIAFLSACSHNNNIATSHSEKIPSEENGLYPLIPIEISESETVNEISFFRKQASDMNDNTGWYYVFEMEAEKMEPSNRVYIYIGTNLRYRYRGEYWSLNFMEDINSDGSPWYKMIKVRSGRMSFGEGGEAEWRDRKILNKLMAAERTPEELLSLNPDDYSFEVLDKDLFFRLMHAALEGENTPEGKFALYWEKPMTGMSVEPYFIDGYKFQIGFAQKNAIVDEIYIDVLYQTGEAYNDYQQLSDMVDSGEASEEQKEAFTLIQSIRKAIKEQSWYLADAEKWKEKEIGGIDFSRLYSHLEAIHRSDFHNYTSVDELPIFVETLTKEEYEAAKREYGYR